MSNEKLDRKLRKRARKLAKWAKKHGIEHVDVYAIGPTDGDSEWFATSVAYIGDVKVASFTKFYKEDEL